MDADHRDNNELATPDSVNNPGAAPETPSPPIPVLPRYICAGDADIRVLGNGTSEKGRITNLSFTGCCVNSSFPFEPGDRVEVILQVNKLSFRVAGEVVHVPSLKTTEKGKITASGMGIKFQKMSAGRAPACKS
jgi:hypothetical protein